MRTSMLLVLAMLFAVGCGDDKKKAAPQPTSCTSNEDCLRDWLCMDEACVDPDSKAIYTDPQNAVTPEKVKRELQRIGDERQKKHDQLLDGL